MSEQTADLGDEVAEPVAVPEEADDQELPEVEAEEPQQEEDTLDAEDGDEDEEQDEEPEYDEIDLGGNPLRVPKGTVPEDVLAEVEKFAKGTWSDYTRKNQELSERIKAADARDAALRKLKSLDDETMRVFTKGAAIKNEIEQLQAIDMDQMWQSDRDRARQISDIISQKQAEFQRTLAEVNQREHQFTQEQQAEMARRASEGKALVEKTVKGFNPDEVTDYVVKNYATFGISAEDAQNWQLTPGTAVMAHKAMLYDRMQAKAKPASKKVSGKPAQPVKSMKSAGRGNARAFDPVRDADKMSVEEWVKREEARLAKKRA